ncbi:MAG TPA: YjbH domain-containing protein [Armatimonadota bacterium]|nr:YjbH domain-containing protein [Armatimonadota bacterium]
MRTSIFTLLLCLVVGIATASANSVTPSFYGPVGYLFTPSADTLGKGNYMLSMHHRARRNLLAMTYSPLNSVEVGVTMLDPTRPGQEKTEVALNAKLLLLREGQNNPALAVGMWDVADWMEQTPYAVLSKDVSLPWPKRPARFSAGYGGGMYKERGFGGVMLPLSPSVTTMAEFDGTNANVGLRMELPRGFTLDVGAVNWELGVGASFGAKW